MADKIDPAAAKELVRVIQQAEQNSVALKSIKEFARRMEYPDAGPTEE
ncbi:MAG: hypothetical protein ACRYGG_10645 [Janthinobacterium lividum]